MSPAGIIVKDWIKIPLVEFLELKENDFKAYDVYTIVAGHPQCVFAKGRELSWCISDCSI